MTSAPTYLITGGLGSFGSALANYLFYHTDYKIRILDRSEAKMERMMSVLPPDERVTYVLGDIRDRDRLVTAFHRADVIVHAAALKVVRMSNLHTQEFFKTVILGTFNTIEAAIINGETVKKFLLISSDKAVSSISPYGSFKNSAEWLTTAANMHGHGVKFASVRGGNVWNSRGSVLEKWLSQNPIRVHNPNSTRFHLPMDYWLNFSLSAIDAMHGGEIFIPKCNSWRLGDLATAFCEVYRDKTIELLDGRDGDKPHETLLSEHEAKNAVDIGWGYVVHPPRDTRLTWNYVEHTGDRIDNEVSSDRVRKLTIDELRTLISKTL